MTFNQRLRLCSARLVLSTLDGSCPIPYHKWKEWLIDPVVNMYLMSGLQAPKSEDLWDYSQIGLFLTISIPHERWIGNIRLHEINKEQRTAELGIMIGDKAEWGKGYATEACTILLNHAFQKMNLNRVGIGVVELNKAGIALWTKLGFKEEGRLREAFWVDGLPRDVIRMGLLQREWFDAHRGSGTSKTG